MVLLLAACNVGETRVAQQPISVTRQGSLISLTDKPSNVALADLNKDDRLDLIVASEARTLTVIFGDKTDMPFRAATARTITRPESPGEMVFGDVYGDDRLDLALDSHDSYNVTLPLK